MWRWKRSDRDFADEIEAHIALEADRLIASGMPPANARDAAARAFGNRTSARERFHESTTMVWLEQFVQDARYAARSLARTPGFALVAIACLAIGIGVNAAAFSLFNAILFRAYPGVERQHELARISIGFYRDGDRIRAGDPAAADWHHLRAGLPAFSGIAAYANEELSMSIGGGEPQVVRGHLVSGGMFDMLGTRPAAGRLLRPSDDLEDVAVISHRLWTRAFNAQPDIAGQPVTVGARSYTIVGVAPPGFFGLTPAELIDPDVGAPELFVPLAAGRASRFQVWGRRTEGATIADVTSQANAVAARIAAGDPAGRTRAFAEVGAGRATRGNDELVSLMLAAMAVPAIILLVACANLANQLLARAVYRRREIAVRLSLGATRARVVRQLLVETAVLALAASAIGVLLARWLLDLLRATFLALPFRIAIDARVLAFTIGLALLTALFFGLAPALGATRTDLTAALKDGGAGGGYRKSRMRSALVVVQIAASLALIAIASVFTRAAQRPPSAALDALNDRALLMSINLDLLGFDSVTGRAYQAELIHRLGAVPGVVAAGMSPYSMFDMVGSQPMTDPLRDDGRPEYLDLSEVSGDWLEATNSVPLRGRAFTVAERAGRPTVAIVDELIAQYMWHGADALGRTLRIGSDSSPTVVTVVGIVPTRQEVSFREAEGVVIIPGQLEYRPRTVYYIRTGVAAASLMEAVRRTVRNLDARVPILTLQTVEEASAFEGAGLSAVSSGMTALGGVALALAALGLFGVLSFIVAQRRREIGVRVALGAQRGDVIWMVLRQALALGAGGVAAGALVALAAVALLRAIIHGLQQLDLVMFGAMSAAMVVVALLASAVPARRAASIDPIRALRAE